MNRSEAIKAMRIGAILAFVSAGSTLVFMVYAIWSNSQHPIFGLWNDWTNLIDVGLLFIFGVGVMKHSRAAAVAILLYWISSRAYVAIEIGAIKGVGIGLIFLYYYGRAIQGAFKFHQISKQEDADYKPAAKWTYIVSVPLFMALTILLAVALLTLTGQFQPLEVVAGADMREGDRQLLLDREIVTGEEGIKYFYAYGLTSVLEGGAVLSDIGVTTYFTNAQDELEVYWLPYDQISSVELFEAGTSMDDSVYQVNSVDEDGWIRIQLSTTDKGDIIFVEEMRKEIKANQVQTGSE
ncbi:MAG: hypothetical protein QNK19_11130 [Xanthomonadales bacterium]|nr:hypothetical protein [Xanthomonadales bacterium]